MAETGVRIVPRALGAHLVEQLVREVLLNGDDTLAVTNTNDQESTTAVVTIRIPCGADTDLVTNAEERLSRAANIDDVTIDELHGIEPKLSATVITVEISLRWTKTMARGECKDRLDEVSGVESVKRIK